jgi:hypothetical protein
MQDEQQVVDQKLITLVGSLCGRAIATLTAVIIVRLIGNKLIDHNQSCAEEPEVVFLNRNNQPLPDSSVSKQHVNSNRDFVLREGAVAATSAMVWNSELGATQGVRASEFIAQRLHELSNNISSISTTNFTDNIGNRLIWRVFDRCVDRALDRVFAQSQNNSRERAATTNTTDASDAANTSNTAGNESNIEHRDESNIARNTTVIFAPNIPSPPTQQNTRTQQLIRRFS